MQRAPRFVTGAAATLIAALLLAGGWSLTREPPPLAQCRLADGSTLRLEAVTRGPVHHVAVGPYWRRLLAALLPPSLRGRVGTPFADETKPSPNSIIFWTSRNAANPLPGAVSAEVFDERGYSYPAWPDQVLSLADRSLDGWETEAAPRRGRTIGLRLSILHPGSRLASVAELRTTNPWRGPYPAWQPEPLPAVKREGDLGVTLTSLLTGCAMTGGKGLAALPGEPAWTRARFRFTWRGKPTVDWVPIGVTLRDPTGNQITPPSSAEDRQGNEVHFDFHGSLCLEEPVWKLRFELAPTPYASFDPADLWSVGAILLPKPKVFHATEATVSRYGTTVRLLGIAGPGARLPDGSHAGPERATLLLRSSPPLHGLQLLVTHAVDDCGRPIRIPGSSASGNGELGLSLEPLAGAKSVRVVFALSRSRFVEFLVHPTRA